MTSKVYGANYGAITPGVTYCYDGKVIAGSTGICSAGGEAVPFATGRLSMVQRGVGSSPVSSTSYVYDSLGRVALKVQRTAGVPSVPFQDTYNALDEVTLETGNTERTTFNSRFPPQAQGFINPQAGIEEQADADVDATLARLNYLACCIAAQCGAALRSAILRNMSLKGTHLEGAALEGAGFETAIFSQFTKCDGADVSLQFSSEWEKQQKPQED